MSWKKLKLRKLTPAYLKKAARELDRTTQETQRMVDAIKNANRPSGAILDKRITI